MIAVATLVSGCGSADSSEDAQAMAPAATELPVVDGQNQVGFVKSVGLTEGPSPWTLASW